MTLLSTRNNKGIRRRHGLNIQDPRPNPPIADGAKPHSTVGGLASHTAIATTEGWTPMGDLAPGQKVFDERGEPCQVLAVFLQGEQPLFQVDLDDGSSLVAAQGQPWHTLTHYTRSLIHQGRERLESWSPVLLPPTTGDIEASLLHISGNCIESMHTVPLARSLQLPCRELLIDPYLLGLWLGDGSSRTAEITCHQDDEPHYRQKAQAAGENWRIKCSKNCVHLCCRFSGSIDHCYVVDQRICPLN